ncbi:MAG: ankyrin repeat domain-containing protein [Candidatus Xenobiia bacterium LiM19]
MADGTSELIDAVRRGDEKKARAMLEANPSLLKARDGNGFEPVHHAAVLQSSEIITYLVSRGADVSAQCFHGLMPLHCAKSKEVMDFLIANGALVEVENNYFGKTPLHYAALKGDLESMKLLISHGANVNARDKMGRTPLHSALSRGNKEAALFLHKRGAGIRDIYTAAALGIMNKLRALLDNNQASVNVPEYGNQTILYFSETGEGRTAIHYAVMYRQLKAAKYLISRGADVNTKTMHDVTPLEFAAEMGYREMVELLVSNGADLNYRGTLGMTPLYWAALRGHEDIAQLLILKGADTAAENDSGTTFFNAARMALPSFLMLS